MNAKLFSRVALLLTGALTVSAGGAYVGLGLTLTAGSLIGLFLLSLLIMFALMFVAHSAKEARSEAPPLLLMLLLGGFTFLMGLISGPAISHYLVSLGAGTVMATLLGTSGIMGACGAIACLSGKDFRPLERILFFALFGLIIVGLISIFTGMSATINILYCLVGIAVFIGYFLVDFSIMAHSGDDSWGEAAMITTSLFLDFLNLFLYLLRLLEALQKK